MIPPPRKNIYSGKKRSAGVAAGKRLCLQGYGWVTIARFLHDRLRELYDYDNSAMLEALAERGFFIASRAHSNYCQTGLSLASSLN